MGSRPLKLNSGMGCSFVLFCPFQKQRDITIKNRRGATPHLLTALHKARSFYDFGHCVIYHMLTGKMPVYRVRESFSIVVKPYTEHFILEFK